MSEKERREGVIRKDSSDTPAKGRSLSRADFLKIAGGAAGLTAGVVGVGITNPQPARAQKKGDVLDTPTITCGNSTKTWIDLNVCAGGTGAPAGFSIQWAPLPEGTECKDFVWPPSDNPDLCKASFSGVPGCSVFNLGANACTTVRVGELQDEECGVSSNCFNELECGTTYVFRAFAHNETGPGGRGRSAFTANLCCSTEDCLEGGCVFTQGYWKTHGPEGCNPSGGANVWPVTGLVIGTQSYTDAELCTNLNLPGAGNAVRILSHQLIAAMLNVANGATPPPNCDIDAASALLTGLNINTSSVAPSSTLGQQMTAAANCLDLYNNGDGGVTHCP
jgi:hypothetical protein